MDLHPGRRLIDLLCIVVLVAAFGLIEAGTASAGAPYCGLVWGSGARSGTGAASMSGDVAGARLGRHACYDRLVLDVSGPVSSWSVGYVSALVADPSGSRSRWSAGLG